MKQQRPKFLLCTLLLATAVSFTACQDDDDEVVILSPVAGDYLGAEACPPTAAPGASQYQVHVYNQADVSNGKVYIGNIYDIGGVYEGTVSGNTITVPSTPYEYTSGRNTYKGNLSANGTIKGSVLTLNFKLDGDLEDECVFVGNKDRQ
jgi:hypothetical protein